MVFQSFNLFSHLTIVENVMLAQTELKKRSRQEAYERSMALLNTVGLRSKAFNYPSELSGGLVVTHEMKFAENVSNRVFYSTSVRYPVEKSFEGSTGSVKLKDTSTTASSVR